MGKRYLMACACCGKTHKVALRDARLLADDNLSQEPMEQAGTIVVTSANEPVVVDSVKGSEDRARIFED